MHVRLDVFILLKFCEVTAQLTSQISLRALDLALQTPRCSLEAQTNPISPSKSQRMSWWEGCSFLSVLLVRSEIRKPKQKFDLVGNTHCATSDNKLYGLSFRPNHSV